MPIVIRTDEKTVTPSPEEFRNEEELESLLAHNPALLRCDAETHVAHVTSQLNLPDAGRLDLLMVDAKGLPIAVEVKLVRNAESRRDVIAQAIDYVSSLTNLTVDELDRMSGGKLEQALMKLAGGDESLFAQVWDATGMNLRSGRARLIVALDEAPRDLQRIFRFLARYSSLDLRIVTVQRHRAESLGEIFASQLLVDPEAEDVGHRPRPVREPLPELHSVIDAYNQSAPVELKTFGSQCNYRQIRAGRWGASQLHYEFVQRQRSMGVELHIEGDEALPLARELSALNGAVLSEGTQKIEWDNRWSAGRGRLRVLLQLDKSPAVVAQAMNDLIHATALIISFPAESLCMPVTLPPKT